MSDDIFGDRTGGLDVSDAALEAKWEDAGSVEDPALEAPDPEETEEVEGEVEEPAEVEETEEEEAPAPVANVEKDEDDFTLPPELADKSPEELARMVLESQSLLGRHSNEVGEVRKQMEQMQQAFQQQLHEYALATMQMQNAPAFDESELTYGQALDLLDQGVVGVDVIDRIIEDAYEAGDTRQAREMERDFMYRMARAEAMQATNARVSEVETKYAPAVEDLQRRAVESATIALYTEQPEDANAYAKDVVKVIQNPSNRLEKAIAEAYLENPKAGLDEALKYARGVDPTRSKAYRSMLENQKADSQVETGGGNDPAPKPLSPADKVRASVFGTQTEDRLSVLGF